MASEERPDTGVAARAKRPLEFDVRPARPGDARSFFEAMSSVVAERRYLRSDVLRRSHRDYRKVFRQPWTDDHAQIVAVENGRVIGHLGISREDHPVTRHVASIGMFVVANRRGRGVGSALMAEAIGWAGSVGVEKIALSVYPDNDAARSLYRKFGFAEEGRLTGHSKKAIGYRDEIVMGRWLTDPRGGGPP